MYPWYKMLFAYFNRRNFYQRNFLKLRVLKIVQCSIFAIQRAKEFKSFKYSREKLSQIIVIIINIIIIIITIVIIIIIIIIMLLFYVLLCCFIAVLNAEIFLLGELQLVPKGQEDTFTLRKTKTFLNILAVSNKTDFCTIPTFTLIPSVSIHPLKPLLIHPRAPKTTSTTPNFFSDQSLFSSLFKFWYFSIFLISFSCILQSPGIATSMMTHDFAYLSTKIKSGLLASITLSHWIFLSQINLTSSSSTTPSGQWSYHFSFIAIITIIIFTFIHNIKRFFSIIFTY